MGNGSEGIDLNTIEWIGSCWCIYHVERIFVEFVIYSCITNEFFTPEILLKPISVC